MTTHYTETDPLDWGDLVAVPHFTITVDAGQYDMGGGVEVTADLTHVMLGHLCPRGRVDGIELTADQAIAVWGLPAVIKMEAAAAAGFDWEAALSDEAHDRADHQLEQKRDAQWEAA